MFFSCKASYLILSAILFSANASMKASTQYSRRLLNGAALRQRSLNAEACLADQEAFYAANVDLKTTSAAYDDEKGAVDLDCESCTIDGAAFSSAAAFRQACDDADGVHHLTDAEITCTVTINGVTDSHTEKVVNVADCFPKTDNCDVASVTEEGMTALEEALQFLSGGEKAVDCDVSIRVKDQGGTVIYEKAASFSSAFVVSLKWVSTFVAFVAFLLVQ